MEFMYLFACTIITKVTQNNTGIVSYTYYNFLYRNTNPARWLITLGDHDLTKVEPSQITSSVESITINANYNEQLFDSDIALMKLSQPVTYTDEVSPICLPEATTQFDSNVDCTVTGWGDNRSKLVLNNAIFCINEKCNIE